MKHSLKLIFLLTLISASLLTLPGCCIKKCTKGAQHGKSIKPEYLYFNDEEDVGEDFTDADEDEILLDNELLEDELEYLEVK